MKGMLLCVVAFSFLFCGCVNLNLTDEQKEKLHEVRDKAVLKAEEKIVEVSLEKLVEKGYLTVEQAEKVKAYMEEMGYDRVNEAIDEIVVKLSEKMKKEEAEQ